MSNDGGINTFADCPFRKECIEHNHAFDVFGWDVMTDPGLLDWSECTYGGKRSACESNLSDGICDMGFVK